MIKTNYHSYDIVTCITWSGEKFKKNKVYNLDENSCVLTGTGSKSVYNVRSYSEFRKAYKNERKRELNFSSITKVHNPW